MGGGGGAGPRAPLQDPPLFPDQISKLATTMFSNQVEQRPLDLVLPELNIAQADKRISPLFIYVTPIAEPLLEKRLGRSVSLNNYILAI